MSWPSIIFRKPEIIFIPAQHREKVHDDFHVLQLALSQSYHNIVMSDW